MRIVEASNVAIMVTIRKVLEEEGIDKSLAVSLKVLRALQASGVQSFRIAED